MFLSDLLSTLFTFFTFQGKNILKKPQSVRKHGHRVIKQRDTGDTYRSQDFVFMSNAVKPVSLLVLTRLILIPGPPPLRARRDQLRGRDRRVRRASLSERRHLPGPRGRVLLPVRGRLPGPRLRAQHRRVCQHAMSERGQVYRQGQQVRHSSGLRKLPAGASPVITQ